MDLDYGIPRELSNLQKQRSLYHPELPPCLQGTTVRVEYGDDASIAFPTSNYQVLLHDSSSSSNSEMRFAIPGCSQDVLKAALSITSSATDVLLVMSAPTSNGQALSAL